MCLLLVLRDSPFSLAVQCYPITCDALFALPYTSFSQHSEFQIHPKRACFGSFLQTRKFHDHTIAGFWFYPVLPWQPRRQPASLNVVPVRLAARDRGGSMHATQTNSKGNLPLLVMFPCPGFQAPVFTVLSRLAVRIFPQFHSRKPERERETQKPWARVPPRHRFYGKGWPCSGAREANKRQCRRISSGKHGYLLQKKYGTINQGRTRAMYTEWPEHEET